MFHCFIDSLKHDVGRLFIFCLGRASISIICPLYEMISLQSGSLDSGGVIANPEAAHHIIDGKLLRQAIERLDGPGLPLHIH